MKDPLEPMTLDEWRQERREEQRTAAVAAFVAHYLDKTDERIVGTRQERIRQGVELGIITQEAANQISIFALQRGPRL